MGKLEPRYSGIEIGLNDQGQPRVNIACLKSIGSDVEQVCVIFSDSGHASCGCRFYKFGNCPFFQDSVDTGTEKVE